MNLQQWAEVALTAGGFAHTLDKIATWISILADKGEAEIPTIEAAIPKYEAEISHLLQLVESLTHQAATTPTPNPAPVTKAPVDAAPAVADVVATAPEVSPPTPTPATVAEAPPVVSTPEGLGGQNTPDQNAENQVGHTAPQWTDHCLVFVRTMFGLSPNGHEATAISAWNDCPTVNRHPAPCDPPANVPVFWSGGSQGYGHVAVSLGKINGVNKIVSTDIGGAGTVSICDLTDIHARWGLTFLGWTGHLEGVDIYKG
jgi:hypothetical protein